MGELLFTVVEWSLGVWAVTMLVGPFAVMATVRLSVEPRLEALPPLEEGEVPHPLYEKLAALGFHEVAALRWTNAPQSNSVALMQREDGYGAALTRIGEVWGVTISTRFDDGCYIESSSNDVPGIFEQLNKHHCYSFPGVEPFAVLAAHEALAESHASGQVPYLPPPADAVSDLAMRLRLFTQHQVDVGRMRPSGDGTRPTLTGTFIMSWRLMPPFSNVRRVLRHRRIKRRLASLSPPKAALMPPGGLAAELSKPGCLGTLALIAFALLGAAWNPLFGGAFFDPSAAEEPVHVNPAIAAPLVAADDAEGEALQAALSRAGLDVPLMLFFSRDGERVYGFDVPGNMALAEWFRVRATTEETGYYPVIIGDGDVSAHAEHAAGRSPREILELAEGVDAEHWLAERAGTFDDVPHGPWEDSHSIPARLQIGREVLSGAYLAHVAMALVPTRNSWEVPAFFDYGGWNDSPEAEVQIAMLERWHSQWRAEVVGLGIALEVVVEMPPGTRDEAMALAREQFLFCPDNVYQGTMTLERLAGALMNRGLWYFRWD